MRSYWQARDWTSQISYEAVASVVCELNVNIYTTLYIPLKLKR